MTGFADEALVGSPRSEWLLVARNPAASVDGVELQLWRNLSVDCVVREFGQFGKLARSFGEFE